jgi:hypothetical protein
MRTIFEAVTEYLQADDWPLHRIGDDSAYSTTYQGRHGRWVCIAIAYEERRSFVFYSSSPLPARAERRAVVAELIATANYHLELGNFELDPDSDDIRFRTSIQMPGHDLAPLPIANLIATNVATMDAHLPALQAVLDEGASVQEALLRVDEELI